MFGRKAPNRSESNDYPIGDYITIGVGQVRLSLWVRFP
nr:MAG TPA: hypothetical protein [Caudoviricetes sp.]